MSPQHEVPDPDGAAFLVRVWDEGGRFRARITSTLDVHRTAQTLTEVVGSPEAVGLRLAHWLAEVSGGPTGG